MKPGITRWSTSRAEAIAAGTSAETPARMLEQLVSTLTVNLMSSFTTTASAVGGSTSEVDLPSTFFLDVDMFVLLGLPAPPRLRVNSTVYAQALADFGVRLEDGDAFTRPGDTHFAFVIPERAFEDVATIRAGLDAGLFTRRLVASLLMVDFPNPVFSPRREQLLHHIAEVAWTGDGVTYSDAVAEAILAASDASTDGSPELEFSRNWAVGDDFTTAFTERLDSYHTLLEASLTTPEGFAAVYQLAESRRALVRQMPIFESPLLFSTSNIAPVPRAMTTAATVEELS